MSDGASAVAASDAEAKEQFAEQEVDDPVLPCERDKVRLELSVEVEPSPGLELSVEVEPPPGLELSVEVEPPAGPDG